MRCPTDGVDCGDLDPASADRVALAAADRYDELLDAAFPARGAPGACGAPGVDLVLLGLGENGHTASLFPGSVALGESERVAAAALVDAAAGRGTTAAGEDLWRITMTASFINRAASVVFLVSGAAKAEIVKEVLEGPLAATRLPAQLIWPQGGTLRWHLDDDAAALLHQETEAS